jgi:hypothetical protein
MATRIRTLNFLPDIFKTTTNAQFLGATLDQLVAQPNTKKIEGYIGSRFGYGINAKNYYVTEPTKTRTDYQLDPGVVFLKDNQETAKDFISYPGILDALKLQGGLTGDNSRLFESQFYSWDSFTDLDKIINFNQYYWIPEGPERVIISTEVVYNQSNYVVTDITTGYLITSDSETGGSINPSLTLLRGGVYTFNVNQNSQFWIQGEPGVTGFSPTQPNLQTRDVYGVTNNGATNGIVTFQVPFKNALDQYNFPGNNLVDVVSTTPFANINGITVSQLVANGGIDGVTSLDGLTVMFYNTGIPNEEGYVGEFYDETLYDQDGGNEPYVYPGSSLDNNNFEGGYYTDVSATFYTITYLGTGSEQVVSLVPYASIPTNEKITATYGTAWIARNFYRDTGGEIALIPYNSAILDQLYYQDGTTANKVGVIKLIDNNISNRLNIETDILGKKQYTSSSGVVFTNGLKVMFTGDIYPTSYANVEYYVEGVGTAIELIPVQSLISPGLFSEGEYIPFDTTPYDIGNYDGTLYVPVTPDYITIARNAINKNAWSRSNRWFHIDVINATATYNGDPSLVTLYTKLDSKAKRPIIEFYPNLRMFNSGVIGKAPIDFIDNRTTDAFTQVVGQENYYPDVASYTNATAEITPTVALSPIVDASTSGTNVLTCQTGSSTAGMHVNDQIIFNGSAFGGIIIASPPNAAVVYYVHSIVSDTEFTVSKTKNGPVFELTTHTINSQEMTANVVPYSTEITVATSNIKKLTPKGGIAVGQYITDSTNLLPLNSYITSIEISGTNSIITVSWNNENFITGTSEAALITTDTTVDNYALFEGSRVVFAADTNLEVRNKIYVSRFSTLTGSSTPVITLTEADDGLVLPDDQTAVYRGYNYQGLDFYFDGVDWIEGQQKITVNQAPYFDVFDDNGISFGNTEFYVGTSFIGSTLFAYGLGTGADDPVLNFPIRYSSVDNVGDISFDVTLNSDTFDYVQGSTPITQNVNTGYVYNYSDRITRTRQLGWQTAVSPSQQYQIFEFNYYVATPQLSFNCDIAPMSTSETNWPVVQVYLNNVIQTTSDYTITTTDTTTTITFADLGLVDTVVQVLILSNQVSASAYYQIPINLNNNPLNADITQVNVGDIRGQYQSIFYNNPDTTGNVFGPNNYRDLGNLVPWGNRIIQNSASLVLPGALLRQQNHSLFNALLYNSREYITFKTLLVDTVNNTDYSIYQTPAVMLDDALDQMTLSKTEGAPFFWSDMLPSKAAYISNTYSFANSLDVSIYPLSRIYNFSTANYYGVLVYLTRDNVVTQMIRGIDYTISTDAPSLTITTDLLPNDQITINEYNQTYGSYVPNTPTKLGLYPATIPSVVLDTAYTQPTYFIVGHDGSYNKLYGNYTNGRLVDFRDQVLLEYETRVYNNLKLSNTIPVQAYEVMPGFFRDTDYTYEEILEIYSSGFLNWVGQNRVNYKTQVYNRNNEFTFNYRNSGTRLGETPIEQGYWRGLYQYYYDTSNPDTNPWEMIGYTTMPTWWTGRYGPAPYTSDNLVLWNDLAEGIDWNNGNPVVLPQYVRTNLLQVLPVDSNGDLVSPFVSILGNYDSYTFVRDWKVGDVGPTEFSYRRSSSYPFDLMRILALTRPAAFYNLAVDIDNYKYNEEFNQYLVNDRSHLIITNIQVYGNGTAKTSYLNWIVDYEKQIGVDATTSLTNLLNTLDVRLVYRLAGFSDKNLLKFYVEKSSANSNNSSLLIPDESYSVLLYDNQPFNKIIYSGVVVQITPTGYKVYGNSQTEAYFKTLLPKENGNYENIKVEGFSANIAKDYYNKEVLVPYGTEFYSVQEVAQFIESYGKYLEQQGCVFEQIENGIPITWSQMTAEFLYWAQIGWEVGSIATLNPSATFFSINKDSNIVQPLTISQQNFVLNQDLYPIQSKDLSIVREGTAFTVEPLNQGDTISYGQFNVSNIEHGIVFDNITLFNDVIYNLTSGLRQNRITVRGTKTADWNGTIDAQGFILNQDNIQEWSKETKYTKGEIVKYKNKYWIAITIVQAKELFDEKEWKRTDYNEIQKGLLPNSSTRSYESTLYYDTDKANLENDADLLSFSLIGYRPRDYLALADLTDITQINVYKNLIKNKGTLNAVSAFKGANLAQGGIDYEVYENWAIKSGEFGGVLNNNFVEFKLSETDLTGNPAIVSLTDGESTVGTQQEVPLYSLFNYGRQVNSANILETISPEEPDVLYPSAGYVNFNDVKMSSYFYSGLPTARNAAGTLVPLNKLYVRDYFWLANYLEQWQVYSPVSLGSVTQARNNLNGTVTITFSKPHNLTKYEIFAIVNFSAPINGYYLVATVVDPYRVTINLALNPSITTLSGQGVAFSMQSHRVDQPSSIINLDLLDNEFNKTKVWVDTNTDGSWAVYRKSLNYQYQSEVTKTSSLTFGSAVAYTSTLGYLIGDADKAEVYRYSYNSLDQAYQLIQTLPTDLNPPYGPLTVDTSFGATISYSDDIFAISEPTSASPKVYLFKLYNTTLIDDMLPYQVAINAPAGVTEWGSATAISGDKNWLYISAKTSSDSLVYVYRLTNENVTAGSFVVGNRYTIVSVGTTDWNLVADTTDIVYTPGDEIIATTVGSGTGIATNITYEYSTTIDAGLSETDNFGYSISTDYYGDTVVIGAPDQDYNVDIDNYGYTYVYNRTVQNLEAQQKSTAFVPQQFILAQAPGTATQTATATDSSTDAITVSSTAAFSVGDPVIFLGSILSAGAIAENTVYYIKSKTSTTFTISATRGGSTIELATDSGSMTVVAQTDPLYVSVNGTIIADNQYAVNGTTFYVYAPLNAGDIITVSMPNFVLVQTLDNGLTPRIGVQFGQSVDTNNYANEILVGAPFELSNDNVEGAVHRFTNGGEKYGMIVGTSACNITSPRTILLNGYSVTLPIGNATAAANVINSRNITNVFAAASDGILTIQLIDVSLAIPSNKLSLTVLDTSTLSELGIKVYTETQVIQCPHEVGPTQFGTVIKFNSQGSIVVSAPTGTRYSATTFDFTDDENIDNDTVFDNNATQWIDTFANAGAVYMFDYLANYNESLINPGKFVYAQSINSQDLEYGNQPMYGQALDFNDNYVIVGTPGFLPNIIDGQVIVYSNSTGDTDWSVYRSTSPIVDINKVRNIQLFSAETNQTLDNLDYIDPLQGKILGSVRENIDVVSNVDPASYSVNYAGNQKGLVWGSEHVGHIWFNTTNTRFVNYHQNDVTYNGQYWGRVFPGSDVAVYSWIASAVPPAQYAGPGIPFNINAFSVSNYINAEGTLSQIYFFWARNTNVIFSELGKTLSDSIIQSYIANPQNSGISYFAPLLPNTFALYNSGENINANDTVLHITFGQGTNDDVTHNQYSLIRANYADDFLPGLPNNYTTGGNPRTIIHGNTANISSDVPESLYDRMLDSLCGVDESGAVVPNPYLPKSVQLGVLARPRQSFFIDRLGALKNYLTYANEILAQFPIAETRNSSFLFSEGYVNPTTGVPFYVTSQYWEYINWWAVGYDDNTKATLQVPIYADLAPLTVVTGTIVTVAANGDGKAETYIKNADGSWTRIGLANGTIKFSRDLWDYSLARLGFGDNFYDTTPYDEYPSEETRTIIRALNEQIYTNELQIYRNKSLILLFEYIQSETIENQNYLPWLNKTSLIDVAHTIRELRPIEVFKSDNQDFLEGYLNEAKPYHVLIKEFLFKYTGADIYEGDITDFDLPATYNPVLEKYITPELVYANPSGDNQYLPDDPIWQTQPYKQWFDNYGVSITGQNDYLITTLTSYMPLSTNSIQVDNAYGFPINGIITIGTEQIGYSSVDRNLSTLDGLTRGLNNTTAVPHLPGEQIYINLPAVLLLDGGRGYANPPTVTAYIDTSIYPEPTSPAIFKANMNLDSVLSVTVIDPGAGYAVLPKIRIEPAVVSTFNSSQVSLPTNTIALSVPLLQTGDLTVYNTSAGSTTVGGLVDGQRYYVSVLETVPVVIIALYNNYADAINDHNRVTLFNAGTGSHTLSVGAIASCISSSAPVRENQIAMRFDRTTYNSRVTDWVSGTYYGSFYAGSYNNSDSVSSSSIKLQSTQPPIDSILSSAQGVAFEIIDVTNNQDLTWSSRTRNVVSTNGSTDVITIAPSEGGAPDYGYVGPTTGFYIDMPVKFVGSSTGTNLVNEITYYIIDIINDTDIKISDTVGGSAFNLGTATIGSAGLLLYVGQEVNTARLTIEYPGILTATSTTANSNIITTLVNVGGTGGTTGFYTGLPMIFTGNVFGDVVENEQYYVTSVIDLQNFTMSSNPDPLMINITETSSLGNEITCESTVSLTINEPVIFSNMTVAGSEVSSFGGIAPNTIYYVSSIPNAVTFTISASINGSDVTLTDQGAGSGTACLLTSQIDTVKLKTETGSMQINVALPVSPGQINGQLFTLYQTSDQYLGITGTNSNFFERTISAVIGGSTDRILIQESEDAVSNIYVNMPLQVPTTFGGLTASTTYYVTEVDVTTVTVTYIDAGSNTLTYTNLTGTALVYEDMPIVFTGASFGSVSLNTVYFIKSPTSTTFKISTEPGGADVDLTGGSGTMTGTGEYYIKVSTTSGGSTVNLTDATGPVTFTQTVTSNAEFDVSYILGGYRVIITDPGSGYTYDNIITIDGADIGGVSGVNDLTLTVCGLNVIEENADTNNPWKIPAESNGEITQVICDGVPAGTVDQYYLKVVSATEVDVYDNAAMTIPVTGIDFPYTGITSTTVTAATASNDRFTVSNSANFDIHDPVVFTGTVVGGGTVFGGVTLGQTYYVYDFGATTAIGSATTGNTYRIAFLGNTNWNTVAGTTGVVYAVGDFIEIVATGTGTGTVYSNTTTIRVSTTVDFSTGVFNIPTNASGQMTLAKVGDFVLLPEPFYFNSSIVKYNNKVYQCLISNNDPEFILGNWEELQSGDRRLNALDRVIGYYQPTINMPGVDLPQLFTGLTYPNSTYLGNAFAPDEEFPLDTILSDQTFYPTGIDMQSVVWNGTTYISVADSQDNSQVLRSTTGSTWDIQNLTASPIGVTDVVLAGGKYVATSTNNATPILISNDSVTWSTSASVINADSNSLNSIAYLNGRYVAVGENIVTATNVNNWTQVYAFSGTLTNNLNGVSAVGLTNFTGFVAVGKGQSYDYSGPLTTVVNNNLLLISTDGQNWNAPVNTLTTNGFNAVTASSTIIVVVGDNSVIYTSTNGSNWSGPQFTTGTTNLLDITYGNGMFVAVGTGGVIKTSTNGTVWITIISDDTGTTETLRSVIWNSTLNEFIVVGDNNTVLQSSNGSTWTKTVLFNTNPTFYTVQGDPFTAGYGPEELVPGVVTDTVMMTVATRPGTNWDVTQYQHTGYNVVSKEFTPTSEDQTDYSFDAMVQTPAQLSVFVISGTTGLSTTIYEGIDYTIDWVNSIVTLNTPLSFLYAVEKLRIDVYEVGNGDQLVKANTKTDPIRTNSVTGFNEIYVNCNYTAPVFQGSGVIRPTTQPLEAVAFQTNAITNTIQCVDVTNFIVNSPVSFTGAVFGGITEQQVYYVKTVSQISNTITISETYSVQTGLAGPTFTLSSDTGTMQAIIQVGSGAVWTNPLVYHNGHSLVLGVAINVTSTKSVSNTIVCNNTGSLALNEPITFSNTMFGDVINPLQTYYVKSIYDSNEFTISDSLVLDTITGLYVAGPTLALTNATGGALFITNEFAFGIADNGVSAKIIFANPYNTTDDYLSYTLFGETIPIQYGYTIPEVQIFEGDGSSAVFPLTNFVGDDNPNNAIVEIDGLRQTLSAYTIDPASDTITFSDSPADGAVIAVTSYNLTDRQYFSSQYGTTGSGVGTITISSTTHQPGYDDTNYDIGDYSPYPDYVTLASGSTSTLNVNDSVIFTEPALGGIVVGVTYYVTQIINSTDFAISTLYGGESMTLTSESGSMVGIVNGQTVSDITNISNAITAPLAITEASATTASSDEITCTDTAGFVIGQPVIFKAAIFDAGSFVLTKQYKITNLGTTTQSEWNTIAGTTGETYAVGDLFTCYNAGTSGTGKGQALLANFGNISTLGIVYYVRSVPTSTTFTIQDASGAQVLLADDAGNIVVEVGGQPAIRVTTGINHNFTENALVRIDGVSGSTQLNNTVYYAKVINLTQFDLYEQAYNPAYGSVNIPVTTVSSYTGGGYAWLAGLFTLQTTTVSATATNGEITCASTGDLIVNTPIEFTNTYINLGTDIMGGLIAGTTYYVKEVIDSTTFTVSETREGDVLTLSSDSGRINATQWEQVNVDRLWVTVNGERVPSSKLRINAHNDVSILTTVVNGDLVIITSMIPTATPNEEVYLLNVSTTNNAVVYRANTQTRTWLTEDLYTTDEVIYIDNVSRITDFVVQTEIVQAAVGGVYSIGLTSDKNITTQIIVVNDTNPTNIVEFTVELEDTAPILKITSGVVAGDTVTITSVEGNLIYVNGEQIKFTTVNPVVNVNTIVAGQQYTIKSVGNTNFVAVGASSNTVGTTFTATGIGSGTGTVVALNALSGLQRGTNGTGEQNFISQYSEVHGLVSGNEMTNVLYEDSWNSYVYNTVEGDPLQISVTEGANFLKEDRT